MQKLLVMELMYELDSWKVERVEACGGGLNDEIGAVSRYGR